MVQSDSLLLSDGINYSHDHMDGNMALKQKTLAVDVYGNDLTKIILERWATRQTLNKRNGTRYRRQYARRSKEQRV